MKSKKITAAFFSAYLLCASQPAAVQAQSELYPRLFDLEEVRLTEGIFKQAMELNDATLMAYDVDRLLTPFMRQAGFTEWEKEHPNFTNWASDGFRLDGHIGGHYLSALALAYAASTDETMKAQLKERMDYMVNQLEKCQQVFDNNTDGLKGYIGGLPDLSALKFTKYNQYESLILPMQKYLEEAGVDFRFGTEVTNVLFEHRGGKKIATAIECRVNGKEQGIPLTEKDLDLVFVTNGSCTEGTIYGDQDHAPNGDAEVRTSGCWNLWKNIARQDPAFGHPEKFCSDISRTNWESATITTLDEKILPYISAICKRDPRSGQVVTGGIVSCQDSKWLLSWTINRQGQFKDQDPEKVCIWVYGLFTDVPGDYVHKPMKDCTGREITEEWLYHLGVPVEEIPRLAAESAVCVPTMMPYITAFFMPRTKGDRPDVIPDGCVNFAFLGQFADTPRDTVFTTEYSVRTAMEAVYGLLGVDRGVPEVWGSVYDIRALLDSAVCLMDGRSPLDVAPFSAVKKPLVHFIRGTVIEKLLRDHGILQDTPQ